MKPWRHPSLRRTAQVLCLVGVGGLCATVSAAESQPAGGQGGLPVEIRSGDYEIRWHTIAGGGGQAGGGDFQLRGSVGQHSASADHPAVGAGFSLTGGFWVVLTARAREQLDQVFRDRFD